MRGCITTEVFGQRRESIHTLLLLFRFHPLLLIHACFRLFHSFLLKTSLFKVTLKKILFSRGYFESAIPRSLMIPSKITFVESNSCNHLILLWRRMACFVLISVVYVSYFQVCEAEISFFCYVFPNLNAATIWGHMHRLPHETLLFLDF